MNSSSHKHFNAAECPALTLLYDGGCPLCLREVELLGRKDRQRHGECLKLAFVDIDQPEYNPDSYAGISYREAMDPSASVWPNSKLSARRSPWTRVHGLSLRA